MNRMLIWLPYASATTLFAIAVAKLWGLGPFNDLSGYISTALFLLAGLVLFRTRPHIASKSDQRDSPTIEIISYGLIIISVLGVWILAYSSAIFEGRIEWNFGTKLGVSMVMLSIIANLTISGHSGRK